MLVLLLIRGHRARSASSFGENTERKTIHELSSGSTILSGCFSAESAVELKKEAGSCTALLDVHV